MGLRRSVGFGLSRASAPLRTPQNGQVWARARLEKAQIEERYFFRQEISVNPANRVARKPEGEILLALPYDGNKHFTRQAISDVERVRHPATDPLPDALIGHLALIDYEYTDLESLLGLESSYGSTGLRVPLFPPPRSGDTDPLAADDRACTIRYQYQPDTRQLKVQPVELDLQLYDPDTTEIGFIGESRGRERERLRIMQHADFQPWLLLKISVLLHLQRALESARPKVSKVAIEWPTHTSLRSLELAVDGHKHPFRYNPERPQPRLEWTDVSMAPDPDPGGGETRTFRSQPMTLLIRHPGELYQQEGLGGLVEVTVDKLLSGTDARVFDATGRLRGQPQPSLRSVVCTEFSLILEDAFARRILSPRQQLYFDEVIPEEMRVHDIMTALMNLGFHVKDLGPANNPANRWLSASRKEGPDTLRLQLYIEGKEHKARRQRRVPGGITYRTELDSGELRIYLYGQLPRDSKQVVHEMNALRRALHERFDRLPARR